MRFEWKGEGVQITQGGPQFFNVNERNTNTTDGKHGLLWNCVKCTDSADVVILRVISLRVSSKWSTSGFIW